MRVQRTRSSPSALRSPLMRRPLGGRRTGIVGRVFSTLLVLWAPSISPVAISASQASLSQEHSQVPPEALALLEVLKKAAPPASAEFDIRQAGKVDVERVLGLMARAGISFADVNGVVVGHVSLEKLGRALKSRSGRFYRSLVHLGYVYSLPDQRYSAVSVLRDATAARVTLGTSYAIILNQAGSGLRVTGIEHLKHEKN